MVVKILLCSSLYQFMCCRKTCCDCCMSCSKTTFKYFSCWTAFEAAEQYVNQNKHTMLLAGSVCRYGHEESSRTRSLSKHVNRTASCTITFTVSSSTAGATLLHLWCCRNRRQNVLCAVLLRYFHTGLMSAASCYHLVHHLLSRCFHYL